MPSDSLHAFPSTLIAGFLALYFVSIGRVILKRFVKDAPFIENAVLSFSLGIGFIATSVFLLGMIGQIYFWICLSGIGLTWLLSYKETASFLKELTQWFKSLPGRLSPLAIVLSLFMLAHGVLHFIYSLAPPVGVDALWYHLVLAREYAKTHYLLPRVDIVWSFGPQLLEMLLTLGLVFHSVILASLLSLMLSLAAFGALYLFGRRFLRREMALLAVSLFWCMPLVVYYVPLIKNDLAATLFIVLAWDQWVLITQGAPLRRTIPLLSIFLGFAVACKFTVFPSVLVIGIFTLFSMRRRWHEAGARPIFATGFLLFAFIAMPYFIRSYCLTGNPFYPNAYNIFGGRLWDPEIDKVFRREQVSTKSLAEFLLYPLQWSMGHVFGGHVGTPLFLAFLPLLFLWRPLEESIKTLLAGSFLIYTLSYFCFYLRSRYFFPALCLLSLPSAYAFQRLWEEKGSVRGVGASCVALFLTFNLLATYAFTRPQFPPVFGMESKASYLSRMLPYYPILHYANEHTEPDARFALFGVPGYYLERSSIDANVYSAGLMYHTLRTAERLTQRLHELGIRYVIMIEKPGEEVFERLVWKLFGKMKEDGALAPVTKSGNFGLYRFRDVPS